MGVRALIASGLVDQDAGRAGEVRRAAEARARAAWRGGGAVRLRGVLQRAGL